MEDNCIFCSFCHSVRGPQHDHVQYDNSHEAIWCSIVTSKLLREDMNTAVTYKQHQEL